MSKRAKTTENESTKRGRAKERERDRKSKSSVCRYGVALVSRIDEIIGLFCKRALQKKQYSAKETFNFIDPTDRSHPIRQSGKRQREGERGKEREREREKAQVLKYINEGKRERESGKEKERERESTLARE